MGLLVKKYQTGGTVDTEASKKEKPKSKLLSGLTSTNINKYFFSDKDLEQKSALRKEAAKVNECAGGSCAAGAFNWSANRPVPGVLPVRAQLQKAVPNIFEGKYSIKSKPRYSNINYRHNKSIDSWELYNIYKNTDAGTILWDKSVDGQFEVTPEMWKNIPVGAVITQGNTRGKYGNITSAEDENSSHTTTVIGFHKDGTPLVYDNGKIHKLGDTTWDNYKINDIFVPKGNEDLTFSNMRDRDAQFVRDLGYTDEKNNNVTDPGSKYKRSYVNDVTNALNKNEKAIGTRYNISKSFMDKIQDRVVGIGAKESNFNDFGDIKYSGTGKSEYITKFGDNPLANLVGKPLKKILVDGSSNVVKNALNMFDDREQKYDWEVELILEKKLNKLGLDTNYGSDDWKKRYNELRKDYSERVGGIPLPFTESTKSSRGPFKIKNFPSSATELLRDRDGEPLTEGDLNLVGGDVDELRYGSNVAAIHLIESINKFKKLYKDKNLNEDQLLDLATVAYNNQSKSLNPDFVESYIKRGTLKDGYLTKVKKYQSQYLEREDIKKSDYRSYTEEDAKRDAKKEKEKKMNAASNLMPVTNYLAQEAPKTQPYTLKNSGGGSIVRYNLGGRLLIKSNK